MCDPTRAVCVCEVRAGVSVCDSVSTYRIFPKVLSITQPTVVLRMCLLYFDEYRPQASPPRSR